MDNNQISTNDEKEVNLFELFHVLLSNAIFIVLGAILLALAVYFYDSFVVTPQYTSSTTILVLAKEQDSSRVDVNALSVSSQLTNDYVQLITVRDVTEAAIKELGLTDSDGNPLKDKDLKSKLTVSRISDTRMITITASDADPKVAKSIVETVRDIAREHIKTVVNAEAVNVVEQANVPTEPTTPHKLRDTAIGGILGVVIVSVIVVAAHLMDNTIKSSEDIEKYLGITALGVIPIEEDIERSAKSKKHRNVPRKSAPAGVKR